MPDRITGAIIDGWPLAPRAALLGLAGQYAPLRRGPRAEGTRVAAPSAALVWGLRDANWPPRRKLRHHSEVAAASVLGRGVVLLPPRELGWAIPLDTIAVQPRRYARTLPAADRAARSPPCGRARAIISRTAAGLRGAGVGTVLHLADGRSDAGGRGRRDALLRGAEVAVPAGDPRMPPLRTTVIAALRGPVTRRELVRATQRGAAARILPGGPLATTWGRSGPRGPGRSRSASASRPSGCLTGATGSSSTRRSCAATS